MRPARSRTWSVVFLLCLLAIATLLGSVVSGLGSSLFGIRGVVATAPSGVLYVSVFLEQNGTAGVPIPMASVSVVSLNLPVQSRSILQTNESGELQVTLPPAQYNVSVSNLQFRASAHVPIFSSNTTEVDVAVSKASYPVSFVGLSDESTSGYQSPWAPIYMSLGSPPTAFRPNSVVFIDGSYYPNTSLVFPLGGIQIETPATVVTSDLRNSGQSETLWLTVVPEGFMSVSDLQSLSVATYGANIQVILPEP